MWSFTGESVCDDITEEVPGAILTVYQILNMKKPNFQWQN